MNDWASQLRKRRKPEFSRLMKLYGEIYRQLGLLFDDHDLEFRRYISRVDGELPLYLEVTERHRYTTFARLTYCIETAEGVSLDPDVHLRIYHDAHVAEATHCYPGEVNEPLFGALVPSADVFEYRWRVNGFVDRWLEFLARQGHGLNTMRAAEPGEWPELPAVKVESDQPVSAD
ncbi:MAG: DUF1249 domain-containing protein [Xanthomonadales bacterium]|nr:DUF1249 domain-containing protein [Xanthomonadales bacterium]